MKKMIFACLFLSFSMMGFSQAYDEQEIEDIIEQEGNYQNEEALPQGDIERQEEVPQHPEGEINEWTQGQEQLPMEDF